MRIIELDAADWCDLMDFYGALMGALGSPTWHGRNVNAWVDSMLYGGINEIEPPYLIRLSGTSKCSPELQRCIEQLSNVIREAREWKKQHYGVDTVVGFEINP